MPDIRAKHRRLPYEYTIYDPTLDGVGLRGAYYDHTTKQRYAAGAAFGFSNYEFSPETEPQIEHYSTAVSDEAGIAALLKAAAESGGIVGIAVEYVALNGKRTIRRCTVTGRTPIHLYIEQDSDGTHRTLRLDGIQAVSV